MTLYHGTSCKNIDDIMQHGLRYTRHGQRGRWKETDYHEAVGVYVTTELNEARSFACEATKNIEEQMDLETESPDPMDVCVIKIDSLPTDVYFIPDAIVANKTMFMTNAEDIPPQYLTVLRPNEIAKKLKRSITQLCWEETPKIEDDEE